VTAVKAFFQLLQSESWMPRGFFLKKKIPCTQPNTARVLEKGSSFELLAKG
jgi:hypothetical protein